MHEYGMTSSRGVAVIACANVDVLVRNVAELPPPGTDREVDEATLRAAGPGLNAAFVMHALGDGPAVCFGAIGDDPPARLILEECETHGLPTHGLTEMPGERTGLSVALEATDRPRAFLTDLAAAAHFDVAHAPSSFDAFTDALFGGYFVVPGLRGEPTRQLLRRARQDGARTFLDSGWDTGSWRGGAVDEVLGLLPDVDFFLPNHDEVAVLAGTDDPVAGGRILAAKTRRGVVVKVGADGAWWVPRGRDPVHVPAPLTRVVDTTGAGDALNAALIVGLRRGLSMTAALELGVSTASVIVSRSSRGRWAPLPA